MLAHLFQLVANVDATGIHAGVVGTTLFCLALAQSAPHGVLLSLELFGGQFGPHVSGSASRAIVHEQSSLIWNQSFRSDCNTSRIFVKLFRGVLL